MIDIIGLIPARGGSKGIPGKNIRKIAGKPLIAWTIQAALESNILKRIIVSTDDTNIAKVARDWGAEVPFLRPAEFASDTSSQFSVVEHALRWLEEHEGHSSRYCLLLQPTSPLRTKEDILNSQKIANAKDATAVVSVCEANPHPYLVKTIRRDGTLENFIPLNTTIDRRQDMPPAYSLNGAIYLNRIDSLVKERTFVPKDAIAYIMPEERSIDIDTPLDFRIAEFILANR